MNVYLTTQKREEALKKLEDSFVKVASKGDRFICWTDGEGEYRCNDDENDNAWKLRDQTPEWAEEHLIDIMEI